MRTPICNAVFAVAASVGFVTTSPVWAQCDGGHMYSRPDGCPGCARVNADYTSNPTSGAYRLIRNYNPSAGSSPTSGNFVFSVIPSDGGDRKRIPMADPTILHWGEWYYVTGTSDTASTANFCIYKSQNLIDWYPHMMAFDESKRCGVTDAAASYTRALEGPPNANFSSGTLIGGSVIHLQPNRWFNSFWAPQLFMTDSTTVWLSFAAQEFVTTTGSENPAIDCNNLSPISSKCSSPSVPAFHSVFVCSMPVSDFVTGGVSTFFCANQVSGSGGQPYRYGYRKDNDANQPFYTDGGYQQNTSAPPTIPTTGTLNELDCAGTTNGLLKQFPINDPGYPNRSYKFIGVGKESMPSIDPFTFVDAHDSNRKWLVYVWGDAIPYTGSSKSGANISAYPMTANRTMDALAGANYLLRLGHPTNVYSQPLNCGGNAVYNGVLGWPGSDGVTEGGICEGPGVFIWPKTGSSQVTYLTFSRNGYSAPGYGVFYRSVVNQPLSSLAIPSSYSSTDSELILERPIVMAQNRRSCVGQRNFGHGELFEGPGGKMYLIFHAGNYGYCFFRTVFFKEISFNTDGTIKMFSDDGTVSQTDADVFLVPW